MNAHFLVLLGLFFLVLFLLTLAWEFVSYFSREKVPSSRTILIPAAPKDESDPFKHLAETGKEVAEIEAPQPSKIIEPSPKPLTELIPPTEVLPKEPQPEPVLPNVGQEDPWKALMQESAKPVQFGSTDSLETTPLKPREIPLEIDPPKPKRDEG